MSFRHGAVFIAAGIFAGSHGKVTMLAVRPGLARRGGGVKRRHGPPGSGQKLADDPADIGED
jgi:hypothetical protein